MCPSEEIKIGPVNDAGVLGVILEKPYELEEIDEDGEDDSLFVDESADKWQAIGFKGTVLATAQEPDDLEEAVRSACGGNLPPYTTKRVFSRSEMK